MHLKRKSNTIMTNLKKPRNLIRAAILIIGITLMCIGIWQEEMTAIMRKAVFICFECIGIG